jgi:uncharacterized membrane protein YbhN (UPF0104 family)
MNSSRKNFIWLIVKVVVSFLLFYLLFKNFQKKDVLSVIQSTNLYILLPAVIITLIGFIPATLRWKVILGNRFSFKDLLFLNTGSFFFGTVLPGFVFGDAYRFFAGGRSRLFFDSILIDRGTSFFFISFTGFIISIPITELPFYLKLILLILTLIFSVFLIPFLRHSSLEKIKKSFFPSINSGTKELFLISFYSILLHILGLIIWFLLCVSTGLKLSIPLLIAYYSLLQPVSFIPFTFQGAGLREIVLVYFSRITSEPSQKFLILGLLLTTLLFITAFLCGMITGYRWIKSTLYTRTRDKHLSL